MKIAFSHPTGNANVRAAANGLLQADLLAEFHTSIACFPRSALGRLAEMPVFAELKRRSFDKQLQNLTHTWPYKEAGRLLSTRMGLKNMLKHEKGRFCIDAVYRYVDGQVASGLKKSAQQGVDAIYAYEDGALASFRVAKKLGLTCLYDLPIGYWRSARRFLLPEIEKWPDWASTLTGFNDSDTKLSHKDEELRLADCIFVASSFTAGTLNEYPGTLAPVKVIPYGFPPVREKLAGNSFAGNRPLKLLFVGGLSQRKGIADLFEAVRKVGRHAELTIVGNKTTAHCPALDSELVRHKWLPGLPHNDILALMRESDVLVFPSLFEGFGLVITEAMAQGTPVITTGRTAGPDIIKHGHNGWLIEAGSAMQLHDTIAGLLAQPEMIAEAGKAAAETARLRPWTVYGAELAAAAAQFNKKQDPNG